MSNKVKKAQKRKKKLADRKKNQYWCRFCGKYVPNDHHPKCQNKGFPNNMLSSWGWDGPIF